MYARLWRMLPGPWPVRLVIVLALVAAVMAACFEWVYPALAPYMPLSGSTPDQGVG